MGLASKKIGHVRKVILTFKQLGWYVHILAYRSFPTGVSQHKNLAFLSYWYRKKRLQMHFLTGTVS